MKNEIQTIDLDTKLFTGKTIKTDEWTIYEWDSDGDWKDIKQFRFLVSKEYDGNHYQCEARMVNPTPNKKSIFTFIKDFIEMDKKFEFIDIWKLIPWSFRWSKDKKDTVKDYFNGFCEYTGIIYKSNYKNFEIRINLQFNSVKYVIVDCVDSDGKDLVENTYWWVWGTSTWFRKDIDDKNKKTFPFYKKEFKSAKELKDFVDTNKSMQKFVNIQSGKSKII